MAKVRYQLVLEKVTGSEDDEESSIVATWGLGPGEWAVNRELTASVKDELAKSKALSKRRGW